MNHYKPMLAQSIDKPFNSSERIFEVKWDGIRAICYVDSNLSIRSRNQKELKRNFPELEELEKLAKNVVLDGEIILIKEGRPDFQTLIERNQLTTERDIDYMSKKSPATYVIFDILEKNKESLLDRPLIERKKILRGSVKEGRYVVLSLYVEEKGIDYYEAALKKGLEGVLAKKKAGPYIPGKRSGDWLKIKGVKSCDCGIFGFTRGAGRRKKGFGALVLGLYDHGKSVFVGKVG